MRTVSDLYNQAARLFQVGNLAQSEPLLRQILQADPHHFEAHHLLGLLAHQTARHETAVTLLRQAIALNPTSAVVYLNLGIVLMSQRQLAEAAGCFRQTLQLDPNHLEAHINLGNALMIQRHIAEAIACYRRALHLNPLHADVHINLGNALKEQGQITEAIASFQEALRINPGHSYGLNNLGLALVAQGQLDQAGECYRQALRLDPANAKAHYNLGNILKQQGLLREALDCYRQTLFFDPNHVNALNNLGLVLRDQGQLADAGVCFEQALSIDPGNGLAFLNRASLRLLHGDFAGGWPDFEHRWAVPGMAPRSFGQPRWEGASFEGQTLLVHAEQGLGDTIQFLRYLPMAKRRGGNLMVECQPALIDLVAGIPEVDQIVAADAPLPAFDLQIPLLSLPLLFGTTLTTIPAHCPYLRAPSQRVEQWRLILFNAELTVPADVTLKDTLSPSETADFALGSRLNVGIAWQGDPKHPEHCLKSFSLSHFATLAGMKNVRLLSLQVGPGTQQLADIPFPVIDLGDRFDPNSLADLAAVLMTVDLVVTVDTAVAHLAGALGVPTWVVLPFSADWRWLRDRSDSPWYPSLRLFRQRRFGDWADVFARVAEELRQRFVEIPVCRL